MENTSSPYAIHKDADGSSNKSDATATDELLPNVADHSQTDNQNIADVIQLNQDGDHDRSEVNNVESSVPQTWAVSNVPVEVTDSDGVSTVINLASCIGHKRDTDKARHKFASLMKTKHGKGSKYFLPPFLNQNNEAYRKSTIHPFIQSLFLEHGNCHVVADGWANGRNYIRFGCERSRVYNDYWKKKHHNDPNTKTRNTSTKRARIGEHACGFYFNLFWDPTVTRWFFHERNPGCRFHRGHPPKAKTGLHSDNHRQVDQNEAAEHADDDDDDATPNSSCRDKFVMFRRPYPEAELFAMRDSMQRQSTYTNSHALFEQLCHQVQTLDQNIFLHDVLNGLIRDLMHQNRNRQT